MMRVRGLVLFLLSLGGGARRNIRINLSHQDAHQQNDMLADSLDVSAEAQETLIPSVGVFRRVQPSTGALSQKPEHHYVIYRFGPRRNKVTLMASRGEADLEASQAKAAELRTAFEARNPDNTELPGFLPFGQKMVGGRQLPAADDREANFAKAAAVKAAFKERNPNQNELPGYLPFGEKMVGGRELAVASLRELPEGTNIVWDPSSKRWLDRASLAALPAGKS